MAGKDNQIDGSSLRFVISEQQGGISVASVNGALARIEYLYNLTVIIDEYITQQSDSERKQSEGGILILPQMVGVLGKEYRANDNFRRFFTSNFPQYEKNDIGSDDYFVFAAAQLRRFISPTSLLRVSFLRVGSLDAIFQGTANALKVVVDLVDPTAWRAKKENVRHSEVHNKEDEEHTEVMNDLLEEKQRNENLLAKFNTAGAFIDLIKKAKETGMDESEINAIKKILIGEAEKVKKGESEIQILPPQSQKRIGESESQVSQPQPQKRKGKRRR